jgi:hypothetical protein
VAGAIDREITRMQLIDEFSGWTSTTPAFRLSTLAALTHGLERGIRVM